MIRSIRSASQLVLQRVHLFPLALGLFAAGACASTTSTGSVAAAPQVAPELATQPDTATLAAADSVLVRFVTTKGDFDVMLRKQWSPNGAPRVGQVVASGYYDGARFFRAPS